MTADNVLYEKSEKEEEIVKPAVISIDWWGVRMW